MLSAILSRPPKRPCPWRTCARRCWMISTTPTGRCSPVICRPRDCDGRAPFPILGPPPTQASQGKRSCSTRNPGSVLFLRSEPPNGRQGWISLCHLYQMCLSPSSGVEDLRYSQALCDLDPRLDLLKDRRIESTACQPVSRRCWSLIARTGSIDYGAHVTVAALR